MRCLGVLVIALLLVLPWAGISSADDDGEPIALSMRIFHVGALVAGLPSWIREAAPHEFGVGDVWDEERPMFGAEAEEPNYPLGSAEELVEYVRGFVKPAFWDESDGAEITCLGEHALVVRATPSVLRNVEQFLADLERRVLPTVTIEIHAVRLSPEAALAAAAQLGSIDPILVEEMLAEGTGPSLTVSARPGQRASASVGRQRAFVIDYDVSVAEESTVSHPLVWVANLGLMADVTPELSDDEGTLRLEINAALAKLESSRQVDSGGGRTVEVPEYDVHTCRTEFLARPGKWQLVQGRMQTAGDSSAWFLIVRATVSHHDGRPTADAAVTLESASHDDDGVLMPRVFHTRMLARATVPTIGSYTFLAPSNFTPSEPPELREPVPTLPMDPLVELIERATGWNAWESGGSLEARNGRLLVYNTPNVLRAVDAMLTKVRRQLLWSVETTAEVIELPGTLARRFGRKGRRGGDDLLLSVDDREAIEHALADGSARRIETARIRNMGGTRNAVTSGRETTYVCGYAGELAKGASTGNPIVHRCLSGLSLDVEAHLLSTGDGAGLDVRFQRSALRRPIRTAHTPLGNIDLPELDVFRVRTSVTAPFGRTTLVGAGGEHDQPVVVLLTPRLVRHGD